MILKNRAKFTEFELQHSMLPDAVRDRTEQDQITALSKAVYDLAEKWEYSSPTGEFTSEIQVCLLTKQNLEEIYALVKILSIMDLPADAQTRINRIKNIITE